MRFHAGVSFRLKSLKKILFPILIGVLAYFGFGFFGFIAVYAYTNNDTSYNVDIPNYNEYLNSIDCGSNGTMLDSVKYIIEEYNNQYFQLFVGAPNMETGSIVFYLIRYPTISVYQLQYYSYNSGTTSSPIPKGILNTVYTGNTTQQPLYILGPSNCSTFKNSTGYTNFKYIYNNNLTSSYYPSAGDGLVTNNYTAPDYSWDRWFSIDSLDNNSSYNTDLWFYYSEHTLSLNQPNSNSYYNKSVCLSDNNTCYTNGMTLPSYYDLHGFNVETTPQESTFIGFADRLGVFYSNFSPNDVSRFNIDIKFDTNINNISGYDYYQNLDLTNINCYGRINHNDNYYSYVKFPSCTFEVDLDNLNISSDNDLVDFTIYNLEIFDSNDNKITDFSSYDKLFYYISFQYEDDSLDLSVRNLEYLSSYNILYDDYLRGEIYDSFYDLPIYSKLLFSNTGFSNELFSNISARTKKDIFNNSVFLYAQKYNLSSLESQDVYTFVASDSFQNLKVNNSNNIGYMIYNKTSNLNSPIASLKLDLILMRDIIISYNNISSNDFYYSDSSGNIINNNIDIDYSNGLTTDLNDLGGLLPPGPVDSLLNIPFYYTNKVITSLGQSCEPWTFNFVFNKPFTMPCFDTFYEEFPPSIIVFLEVIPCAFILISYFKHLYKKVDRATSLNTSSDDEWGVL